tara:strand:+ start:144 stop:347 length:204 start_codon:yes stop_codon:yes gene_type:complete
MNFLLLVAISSHMKLVSDMETDARALELYLQDKVDYKEHCPEKDWEQPDIEIYKKTLKSHLPDGCKK